MQQYMAKPTDASYGADAQVLTQLPLLHRKVQVNGQSPALPMHHAGKAAAVRPPHLLCPASPRSCPGSLPGCSCPGQLPPCASESFS